MQCLDTDDLKTQYKSGLKYLHGIGVEINLDKAFIYIKNSAYGGYIRAQISLAFMYFHGIGVTKNKPRALIHFKVIADEEYHARSELMVGMIYEYGEGEEENIYKALRYYKRSAKQGNNDAQDKLKWYEEMTTEESF